MYIIYPLLLFFILLRLNQVRRKKKSHFSLSKTFLFLSSILVVVIALFYFSRTQEKCANSISCISDLSGEYNDKSLSAVFLGKNISVPSKFLSSVPPDVVLGESTGTNANKHIYVDLTNQRLYAFEGNNMVYNFLVSTGKWGRTPTGDFNIWIKLRYTRMEGGDKSIGTYYNLPNVPFTMFFYSSDIPKSRGFGLHGTYWHNNFGHPMSHGCVNLRTEDAEKLYYWTNPSPTGNVTYASKDVQGTPITIYGTTPVE